MRVGGRRWLILSATIGAVVTAVIALTPPATEFEPSIYAAYPLWLQTFFALSLAGAVVAAFRGAIDGNRRHWLAAIILVFGLYTVLFSLPTLRQYELFGRGAFDTLAHLGYIETIIETDGLVTSDWYPLVHILGAVFEFVGVPENALVTVYQATLFPVFILSVFLLGRFLFSDRTGMVAASVGLPLVFGSYHVTMQPFLVSFFLFPLVMFAAHHRGIQWSIVTGGLLLGLVFYHPTTSLAAVAYLLLAGVLPDHPEHSISWPSIAIPMLGGVAITYWYLSFERIERLVAGLLVKPPVPNPRGGAAGSLTPLHTAIRATELYGDVALLAGLAAIGTLVVAGYGLWGWRQRSRSPLHLSLAVYIVFGIVVGVGLFAGPVANPIRMGRFFLLFGMLAVGAAVPLVFNSQKRGAQSLVTITVLVVVAAAVLGAGGIYADGNHLTAEESQSVDWMLSHTTTTEPVLSLQMSRKMTYALRGFHHAPEEWRFQKYNPSLQLPPNLGYQRNRWVAGLHESSFYMLTKEHDTEFYKSSYREQWDDLTWYSDDDLQRLRGDPTADHIYSSGVKGASIWRISE